MLMHESYFASAERCISQTFFRVTARCYCRQTFALRQPKLRKQKNRRCRCKKLKGGLPSIMSPVTNNQLG